MGAKADKPKRLRAGRHITRVWAKLPNYRGSGIRPGAQAVLRQVATTVYTKRNRHGCLEE